jgi:dolichyl-phosphate-mannose--protein O-mannosyl transferase
VVYNLTAIYSGGPIDQFNGLTTQSNFVLLDGLLISIAVIVVFVMLNRASSTKISLFVAATFTAIVAAFISFAIAALGYPQSVLLDYGTRTMVWFGIAAIALLWNVLSDS